MEDWDEEKWFRAQARSSEWERWSLRFVGEGFEEDEECGGEGLSYFVLGRRLAYWLGEEWMAFGSSENHRVTRDSAPK
jgi:hypothetical protein